MAADDRKIAAPIKIEAPSTAQNECPFCHSAGYTAPGPCKTCGISGYRSGTPPRYRRTPPDPMSYRMLTGKRGSTPMPRRTTRTTTVTRRRISTSIQMCSQSTFTNARSTSRESNNTCRSSINRMVDGQQPDPGLPRNIHP